MADMKDEKHLTLNKEAELSSASEEDTDEVLPSKEVNQKWTKEFDINHGNFLWRDMEILHDDNPAYWAENSEVTRNKPDMTLHRGSKDGPICGAARYRFSRSITAGLGNDDISVDWVVMKRHGAINGSFQWEWKGRHYTLRRAKSAEHGGTGLQKLLLSHFKIVDDASGEMIALYVSEAGIARKKGTLKIAASVSAEIEILIVLAVTSVRDKQARRAKFPSGGGGGGGGGG